MRDIVIKDTTMHLLKFVNKVAEELPEEDMVNKIRSVLYKDYIKTVVAPGDASGFRMIFIGNRMKGNFNNPITTECNGVVLWYSRAENKFSALAVPPQLFNSTRMSSKDIENKYKSGMYKVYPVLDGTVATFYHFNGEWRLSTTKAYDATDLIMVNGKTYKDIFFESGGSLEFEEGYCYTVCIKNNNFHIFENSNRVTLLQKVNLSTLEKEVIQPEAAPMTWKNLKFGLNNAVNSYKNSKKIFFGVILRSEKESILLESNLMIKLRNFLYNFNFAKKLEPGCDLVLASMLYVYLNRRDVSLYLTLFPFYKKEFSRFSKILDFNVNLICEGKPANVFCEKAISDLSSKKIEIPKLDGNKIVADFVRSPHYLSEFYELVKF